MKVHKMGTKQFAKFVTGLQKQAMKNPIDISITSTDKYDYDCRKVTSYTWIDWEIRRRLGSAIWSRPDTLWAFHNKERHAWTVYEGGNVYEYLDSEIEKAVQNG